MRRALLLLTIAISMSGGVLLLGADDFIVSRFSDYLDAIRSQAGIPGLAVALVRTGETTVERGYGRVDLEHGIASQPTTTFELDGTTQTLTAAMVLRCVEEGRLSLDDRLSKYSKITPGSAADVTLRQSLSHTIQTSEGLVFNYNLARLDSLAAAVATCWGTTFRQAVATQLERLGMLESVPGADAVTATEVTATTTPAEIATLQTYSSLLQNLAKPYAVDSKGRTTPSVYTATTLTAASGLISTVHDLTRFDAALRKGTLIKPETLAEAWTPPVDRDGLRLPHGFGWFVQGYNGERVVWQFGVSDNASSSMIVMVPGRGLTLILVANSQGLVRPFALSAGDVTVSPFAKLFLSVFVR